MKKTVANLHEALTFELEGMYEITKGLQDEISESIAHTSNPSMKKILAEYLKTLGDQRIKLKRIFGYLLTGPYKRQLKKAAGFLSRCKEVNSSTDEPSLRAILFVSSMQPAVQYKIAALKEARFLALRLDIENVADLLDEMIEGEQAFAQTLKRLASNQVNLAYNLAVSN
jgi:ferritin-like metal-binding protein YciE